MASVVKRPNGTREIAVVVGGKRPVIRLGKVTAKKAETAKVYIEELASCKELSASPQNATIEWVNSVDPKIRRRLEKAGFVEPQAKKRARVPGLAKWIETYRVLRRDVKPGTLANFHQVRDLLLEYFPVDKRLDTFSYGDAEDLGLWLRAERKPGDGQNLKHRKRKLAEGAVRRHLKRCKQFFTAAVKRGIVTANCFEGVKTTDFAPDRFYFVTPEEAAAILDACPDAEWRMIFGLARFGGIRIPSELANLEWADVNFERSRFIVKSPKTEHHDGKGTRAVPVFPELMPLFLEALDAAETGERYVIARRHRDSNANLRTQLVRIIKRAGLKPWPKLFTNLRSTRLTELAERFPIHVVTSWLGNSPTVAAKHYLQVTTEHFERAAGTQSAAESAAQAQQIPQQKAAAEECAELQEAPNAERNSRKDHELCASLPSGATSSNSAQIESGDPIGI